MHKKSTGSSNPKKHSVGFTLVTSLVLIYSTAGLADEFECESARLEANNMAIAPFVPGVTSIMGVFSLTVDDNTRVGESTGEVLDFPETKEDGTLHIPIQLDVNFGEGDSIRFTAKQVHSPTDLPGEFRLNERVRISEGTGRYAEAIGRFVGHGTSSFNTLEANAVAKGIFCNLETD